MTMSPSSQMLNRVPSGEKLKVEHVVSVLEKRFPYVEVRSILGADSAYDGNRKVTGVCVCVSVCVHVCDDYTKLNNNNSNNNNDHNKDNELNDDNNNMNKI